MTFKEQLKEIAIQIRFIGNGDTRVTNPEEYVEADKEFNQAVSAITELVIELIGLDEEPKYAGENHLIYIEARNALRAELKSKVTGQDSP